MDLSKEVKVIKIKIRTIYLKFKKGKCKALSVTSNQPWKKPLLIVLSAINIFALFSSLVRTMSQKLIIINVWLSKKYKKTYTYFFDKHFFPYIRILSIITAS